MFGPSPETDNPMFILLGIFLDSRVKSKNFEFLKHKHEIQTEAETITPVRREKQNGVLIIDGKEVSLPLFNSRHGDVSGVNSERLEEWARGTIDQLSCIMSVSWNKPAEIRDTDENERDTPFVVTSTGALDPFGVKTNGSATSSV